MREQCKSASGIGLEISDDVEQVSSNASQLPKTRMLVVVVVVVVVYVILQK